MNDQPDNTPIDDDGDDADKSVMEKLYNEAEAALDEQDASQNGASTPADAPEADQATRPGRPVTLPEEEDEDATMSADTGPVIQEDATIIALKEEAEKNRAGWQRALADFQNYKRRTEREIASSHQRATLDTLTRVLPVIDDFERALANVPDDLQGHSWMNGVELILNKLAKLLDEHNVTVIDPVGEVFDPTRHEAIGMDESDEIESGHVTVTLQKGYEAEGRILRPALVRVAG